MTVLDHRHNRRRWLALLSAATLSTTLGCQTVECIRCPDYSAAAVPPPPGTYVCRWIRAQDERAEEIDFVIHQHEWYQDGEKLGPQGRQHLQVLAQRMQSCASPVIIEPIDVRVRGGEDIDRAISRGRELDHTRRFNVVQMLAEAGVLDADARVVIETPRDEGLYGAESRRIYQQLLQSGTGRGGIGQGAGLGNGGTGFSGSGGINAGGFF